MTIPFVDLKSQYARLRDDIQRGIDGVLEHGQYILGPEVDTLEGELARFAEVEHCVSCASGTDALVMALLALGIGPGDAVFTSPFTYVATVEAIRWVGARPVFVDIDARTFNIDVAKLADTLEKVSAAGESQARCIMPVDLFGLPADYAAIMPLAEKYDLTVIGDGAQAFGSTYHDKPSAAWPHIYTTSFFPAKPLGCYGDGGAIFTNDADLAADLRSIRVHGSGKDKYDTVRHGLNGRLDTLQAAILLPKLRIFPDEIEARGRVAERYGAELADSVTTPTIPQSSRSAWAQYSILSPKRDAIREALRAEGIPTAVYYEKPLHLQTAMRDLGYGPGDMPAAEAVAKEIVSLPMHPYLDDATIARIAAIARRAAS